MLGTLNVNLMLSIGWYCPFYFRLSWFHTLNFKVGLCNQNSQWAPIKKFEMDGSSMTLENLQEEEVDS